MKKTAIAIIVAVFGSIGTSDAQQKFGHINSIEVIQGMAEFKQMSTDIQKQKDSYSKALEGMYGDYEKKQKELQDLSDPTKATPQAILDIKMQELQDLQKRIQDFQTKANDDLQKVQQDKLKPINDKYLQAVKDVSVANGYAYILDIAQGAVPYYTEGQNDVTDLVKKKLGITGATQTPTTTPKTTPK